MKTVRDKTHTQRRKIQIRRVRKERRYKTRRAVDSTCQDEYQVASILDQFPLYRSVFIFIGRIRTMEKLEQIPTIATKIKSASSRVLKVLHIFIFGNEGDKNKRKRLLEFQGFKFSDESDELTVKMRQVSQQLSVGDLVSICNVLTMDYSGTKQEVISRICNGLMDLNQLAHEAEREDSEHDDDEDDESENQDDERGNKGHRIYEPRTERIVRQQMAIQPQHFSLSYKDVENIIRTFDGTDAYPVERWINDFEDAAILFGWSEIQKLVFAKRTLTGLAKLFVQGERGLNKWNELKEALRQEFATKINSAQLHELLTSRRKKKNESIQEYFLTMKEIAAKGNIEVEALMKYVVDGITDDLNHKLILSGASTLSEFKEKLRSYDDTQKKTGQRSLLPNSHKNTRIKETGSAGSAGVQKTENQKKTETPNKSSGLRCFNCGEGGHKSKDCKSKSLGTKCFKCNRFGHVAINCNEGLADNGNKSMVATSATDVNNIVTSSGNRVYKIVKVRGVNVSALIDSGCEVNLIREDVYRQMDLPELKTMQIISLRGFGNGEVISLGCFETVVEIDNEELKLELHVVSSSAMPMVMIIGNNILEQAELTLKKDEVIISKIKRDVFLGQIEVTPESEVDLSHIANKSIKSEVAELLTSYKPEKTKDTDIMMTIVVKEERPIYSRPRRLPPSENEIVERQVEEWIRHGIIETCSSEYASPVIVVRKKDGSPRVCIDYRKVNEIIVKDRHPLPLIEDQLDRLKDAKVFTTLDLRNGFFHVAVNKESRKYTAFVTHSGQYCFLKVPFGLCNSPAVFQRFINHVFRPLINAGIVLIYLDDLIIPGNDEGHELERLRAVLQVASEHGLEINFKKCQFMQKRVEFLGHVIENGKIYPSPDKTVAVKHFPVPRSLKDVRSFLGLTGYFRKFIPRYSTIAKPLSDMLRKGEKFTFDEAQVQAFELLKFSLTKDTVLKIYRPEDETEVHTDASQDGYGAVLLQRSNDDGQMHPVYYTSRKTTPAERKYTSYELEVLAIIEALKKFRTYLLGIKFKVVTDCSAFQKTLSKKDLVTRVARWALLLEEYDLTVEHRSGARMKHVDALSRYPVMCINLTGVTAKIKEAQKESNEIKLIVDILKDRKYKDYFMKNGVLYNFKDGRELLVVPRAMQQEIIKSYHEKGHFAVKKTEELIQREYYIQDLSKKVERIIANCVKCILVNKKAGKQEGFLHPIEKDSIPLYTYHVDHLGPLETTNKNYNHIFAVIDSFTKFVWLYPVKSTTSKEVISKLELQKSIFGNPVQIISDKGSAFTSNEYQEYCKSEGIKSICVTTGLPRSNGQVERLNRTIIPVISKLAVEDPSKWYKHVNRVQQVLNATYHRSTKTTPFELMFGTKMRDKADLELKHLIEEEFQEQFESNREKLRQSAKEQIEKVQLENRKTYNLRRRKPTKHKLGEIVAIKKTQLGPGTKLKAKFAGPYKIIKVKPNDTYDVERIGGSTGPLHTSTCAEYIKPWTEFSSLSESDIESDGRV